jgi:hypothetical protein
MNTEWHKRHVLSRAATLDERIAWHREHQKQCACRPIPAKLKERLGPGDRLTKKGGGGKSGK